MISSKMALTYMISSRKKKISATFELLMQFMKKMDIFIKKIILTLIFLMETTTSGTTFNRAATVPE